MVSAMSLLLSVGNVKCHTKFNKENHLTSSEVERGHTYAHACMYARTRVHVNTHTHRDNMVVSEAYFFCIITKHTSKAEQQFQKYRT